MRFLPTALIGCLFPRLVLRLCVPLAAVSFTAVPALASCVTTSCPPETTVTTFDPVIRRFAFANCGAATESFDYTLVENSDWATDQAGTVTLAPGASIELTMACTPPFSFPNSCRFRSIITLTVKLAGSAEVFRTCTSRMEFPSISVPVCPPPILASPGDTVHVTLWATNPNPNPRRFYAFTGDLVGWIPQSTSDFKIDPGGSVALARTILVPPDAACSSNGIYLTQLIYCDPIVNNYPTCYTALDVVARNPVLSPELTLTGPGGGYTYGTRVLATGDVNGDGAGDFAVVRLEERDGPAGSVQVFFGGASVDAVPDGILQSAVHDGFGWRVAAGDVNADGAADLVVSAPQAAGSSPAESGRVAIYFGGPGFDAVADAELWGPAGTTAFGNPVAFAGDVNGDGSGDLAVCAPPDRVVLYFGGPAWDQAPDLVLAAPVAGRPYGYAIAGGEDVNADGFGDLVLGYTPPGFPTTASALVYFGGPSLGGAPDLTLAGAAWGDLGRAVGLCDLNADGAADIVAGAPGANDSQGLVYVYRGGVSLDAVADWTLGEAHSSCCFGRVLATGFDLDGDGFRDLAVGLQEQSTPGHVRIYRGGPEFGGACSTLLRGKQNGDEFGSVLSMGPDVTGDGRPDLVIAAPEYVQTGHGEVYLYSGAMAVDAAPPGQAADARRTTITIDQIVSHRQGVEIRYRVSGGASMVRSEVFSVAGRRLRSLEKSRRTPGTYRLEWDRRDETGLLTVRGVYLLRMRTESATTTHKMVLQ